MILLRGLSIGLARFEMVVGAILAGSITVLILLNVVTRSMGHALYWVDEAAISAMVWMGFLGASVTLHYRQSVSVTLIPDALTPKFARPLGVFVDVCVLAFALVLLVLTWFWFDPLTLAETGFDTKKFSGQTFNFIYSEPTTTIGMRKIWFWLIMPYAALTLTLHALRNLAGSIARLQEAHR